jgi:hypothetical protein
MEEQTQQTQTEEMSDNEAIMKIAAAMKDNAPSQEEKQNVHTFLFNVVTAKDTTKIGNLRDDKDYNELGFPNWTVRGSLDMARISGMVMDNPFFEEYFKQAAEDALATSLSRNGFLIRQASVQTRQIVDATRRKKTNKGWFKKEETSSGGDITSSSD